MFSGCARVAVVVLVSVGPLLSPAGWLAPFGAGSFKTLKTFLQTSAACLLNVPCTREKVVFVFFVYIGLALYSQHYISPVCRCLRSQRPLWQWRVVFMSRLGVTALDGLAKTKEADKVCCFVRTMHASLVVVVVK